MEEKKDIRAAARAFMRSRIILTAAELEKKLEEAMKAEKPKK